MVDAKELRIGNWVYSSEQEPIRIEGVHNKKGVFHGFWHNAIVYPIPLTVEWLERFGFKYSQNEETYLGVNSFFIEDRSTDKLSKNVDKEAFGVWSWQSYLREVKYVHQLQNLYFAITGEELEVK